MFDKKLTPKAQRYRKRQLERMGFDEDKIRDILDYEFELKLGRYPRSPLPGKKYEDGGEVSILDQFTNAELREILRTGTEGIDNLYGARRQAYVEMIDNQNKGIPNFARKMRYGGSVKKMHAGGEVRGMGAAIRGTKFKGVF